MAENEGTDKVKRKSKKAELDRSAGKGVSAMRKDEIIIKFVAKEDFGNFCVALVDDHVPFRLVGFKTVVVHETRPVNLPAQSRSLIEKYLNSKVAELLPTVPTTGKRYLPTSEEASRLFKEFAEKYT